MFWRGPNDILGERNAVLERAKLFKEINFERGLFFPCNVTVMLKLSIVLGGPNHGFRAFGRGSGPPLIRSCYGKRQYQPVTIRSM